MNCAGYLLHDRYASGKPEPQAGWWNGAGKGVETALHDIATRIENDYSRIYHLDYLKELLRFGGIAYLTDCDMIASDVGTIIGMKNPFYSKLGFGSQFINCANMVPGYSED
jgi:hypothetical protein